MINSMTGFGHCERAEEDRKVVVEMKSVNHRYCDINIKMPRILNPIEPRIRSLMKNYVERGKIDVYITYEDNSEKAGILKYNRALAAEYMDAFRQMEQDFGIKNDICVSQLSRFPDILTIEDQETDEDDLWRFVEPAVEEACRALASARAVEGERLRTDLLGKLDVMLENVEFIEQRSPEIVEEYRHNLEDKVKELLSDTSVDENRIVMETAIYADKVCVDEEIVRLKSHIQATRDTLLSGKGVGRKLDFVAQEMNREANTILSKSSDLSVSDRAIALKTDIEKVREQVQNIE